MNKNIFELVMAFSSVFHTDLSWYYVTLCKLLSDLFTLSHPHNYLTLSLSAWKFLALRSYIQYFCRSPIGDIRETKISCKVEVSKWTDVDINYSSKQSSVNKDWTQKNSPCFLKFILKYFFHLQLGFQCRFFTFVRQNCMYFAKIESNQSKLVRCCFMIVWK